MSGKNRGHVVANDEGVSNAILERLPQYQQIQTCFFAQYQSFADGDRVDEPNLVGN
jgi:hypothetical protein